MNHQPSTAEALLGIALTGCRVALKLVVILVAFFIALIYACTKGSK